MTYFAMLLGPDDQLIGEMAIPDRSLTLRMARTRKISLFDEPIMAPSYDVVEFEFCREETEVYQLLHGPSVRVYRQVGW
jgi:hypothetical protein